MTKYGVGNRSIAFRQAREPGFLDRKTLVLSKEKKRLEKHRLGVPPFAQRRESNLEQIEKGLGFEEMTSVLQVQQGEIRGYLESVVPNRQLTPLGKYARFANEGKSGGLSFFKDKLRLIEKIRKGRRFPSSFSQENDLQAFRTAKDADPQMIFTGLHPAKNNPFDRLSR